MPPTSSPPPPPAPPSSPELVVPGRYCGPPSSGNGGWTAGALADHLPAGAVSVRLSQPPPLDTPMEVWLDDGTATALREGAPVATASVAGALTSQVDAVTADVARAAEARYAALEAHPFPTCFSCGTAREPGDGLRIFPGRVDDDTEGRVRVAATWTPDAGLGDERVTNAVAWAALDCVGGWAGDLTERLMVLGSMTAHVRDLPRVGEEHVLVGGARGTSGRRTNTASTLYDASGRAIATAEHVWIAVDPKDFA